MRMRLALCIVLPLCILALGTGVVLYTRAVSLALQEPLPQVETLTLEERYEEIIPYLDSLDAMWQQRRNILQLFIDHNAIDSVSLELLTLRASINTRSQADALIAGHHLREHAQHLLHRDLPLMQNIL